MKVLLEYRIRVKQQGRALHSPPQKAASYGEQDPLQAATYAGSVKVTALLLRYGANANAQGGNYCTALHAAATCNEGHQIQLIDLLLKHGISINAVTERGTVLDNAVALCGEDVITHLLDNSADPKMQGDKWGAPSEVACYVGLYQEFKLLKDRHAPRGGNYRGGFNAAAAGGFEEILTEFTKTNARVPDWTIDAALHFAVKFRASSAVRLLLDHRANVEASSRVSIAAFEALENGGFSKRE